MPKRLEDTADDSDSLDGWCPAQRFDIDSLRKERKVLYCEIYIPWPSTLSKPMGRNDLC